jgi:hypothetical protein
MTAPGRYTKRPITIDAYQFTGGPEQATAVIDWVLAHGGTARYHETEPPRLHSVSCRCDGRGIIPGRVYVEDWVIRGAVSCPETEPKGPGIPEHLQVDTLDATGRVYVEDWVIRGARGEFYPCQRDVFTETYQPAEAEPARQHVQFPATPDTGGWPETGTPTRRSVGAAPAYQFIWWGILTCGCPVTWTSQHPDTLTADQRATLDGHIIDHWDLIDSTTTKVDPSLRHPHRPLGRAPGIRPINWDPAACQRITSYIVEGQPLDRIEGDTP